MLALAVVAAVVCASALGAAGCERRAVKPSGPDRNATSSVTPTVPPSSDPTGSADATASAVPTASANPRHGGHPTPPARPRFDSAAAMAYVRALAGDIGLRVGGTEGERQAADYIAGALRKAGYAPLVTTFDLPGGRESQNVIAVLPGASERRFVLGAHYDTKGVSPGANDNGTGVAALLEIARQLRDEKPQVTVVFAFFGTEEMVDKDPSHHHYGSRFFVSQLSAAERERIAGMLSVDMIGYGPDLCVRTMGRGPQTLRRDLLSYSSRAGVPAGYLKDPGSSGWSDHEAFELAGIPAAWIEWRDDPVYHTARDTAGHVSAKKVAVVGQLVLDYVLEMDAARIARLDAR